MSFYSITIYIPNSRDIYDVYTHDVSIHVIHRQMASSGWDETISEEKYEFEVIIYIGVEPLTDGGLRCMVM